jgi:hypothetical protein
VAYDEAHKPDIGDTMPTSPDEIKYLLEQGARLDAELTKLSKALAMPNQSAPYAVDGISYAPTSSGFSVRLHGLTLLSVCDQVKDGTGDFPELFARITLCISTNEGLPSTPVHIMLLDGKGNFSLDETKNVRFNMSNNAQNADLARQQLSLVIAEAVQKNLPLLAG